MRHSLFTIAFFLFLGGVNAQNYVVTSITGEVMYEGEKGVKTEVKLRQKLSPQQILSLSYKAQIELLEEKNKKKYILKVPGRGALGEMLKDRGNTVLQLTEDYLAYMKTRLKGKGELTSKRHSDPATVTREITVKQQTEIEKFFSYRQKSKAEYALFRKKAINDYAAFMRKAWQSFEAGPVYSSPADDKQEPVIFDDSIKSPLADIPVMIEGSPLVVSPTLKQPVPKSPILEQNEEEREYVEFQYYNTPLRVRFTGKELFKLDSLDEQKVADVYERLQSENFNNTIRDCLELRKRYQLCDWAYLGMLHAFSKACFPAPDEATLLTAFIYQQSGYKMRLGISDEHLVLLFASDHNIFGKTYFTIGDDVFYTYECQPRKMRICEAAYPEEAPMSLCLSKAPLLADDRGDEHLFQSDRYADVAMTVSVNKNLQAFYNDYPSSMLNGNALTRWAICANVELEQGTGAMLLPAFRERLKELDEKEAVERLLNWVQTAFEYKIDEEVWGRDRAFFADETLAYPYCDCEDRSILLSRLVRDLLRLPTALVYYPGHLAMAVGFTQEVKGDYILVDGKRFVVCDPTYINAGVGQTMPSMDNQSAQVIVLGRNAK